jgi:hypothetical protein
VLQQCVDITFADAKDCAQVNETNCFNSSDISFNNVYSIAIGSSSATKAFASVPLLPLVLASMVMMLFL